MATESSDKTDGVNPRIFPGKPPIAKAPDYAPVPSDPPISKEILNYQSTNQPFQTGPAFPHLSNSTSFISNHESSEVLCAPFPPCHPLGCGGELAPIECEECNAPAVFFTLVGLCLLAVLIVFTNVLVIVIIMRTTTLRRRHGLIKVSLATSDLLIGLFAIPAAIYNLATTLYISPSPSEEQADNVQPRFWKPTPNQTHEFLQKNSLASIFFGTILIISLTSSIYNLLLLSFDRFLAVARPLQSRSDKYFSKRRLRISIIIIWTAGLVLSSLPAFLPQQFSYQLDPTTFFYVQTANFESTEGVGPIALFSLFVLGLPFVVIVLLNLSTMYLTIKKLKFSKRHGSRKSTSAKTEQANRMKLIMQTCPEMNYEETVTSKFKRWLTSNNSNNNLNKLSRERLESVSSVVSRIKSVGKSADSLNARVTRMILTMVAAFTVCICPYVAVNAMFYNDTLDCSNLGTVYNISVYLLFLNSAMNFFIYNFWHKEFRNHLIAALKRRPPPNSQAPSTRKGIITSSDRPRFSSSQTSTFARQTVSQYHSRKMGGKSTFRDSISNVDTRL